MAWRPPLLVAVLTSGRLLSLPSVSASPAVRARSVRAGDSPRGRAGTTEHLALKRLSCRERFNKRAKAWVMGTGQNWSLRELERVGWEGSVASGWQRVAQHPRRQAQAVLGHQRRRRHGDWEGPCRGKRWLDQGIGPLPTRGWWPWALVETWRFLPTWFGKRLDLQQNASALGGAAGESRLPGSVSVSGAAAACPRPLRQPLRPGALGPVSRPQAAFPSPCSGVRAPHLTCLPWPTRRHSLSVASPGPLWPLAGQGHVSWPDSGPC